MVLLIGWRGEPGVHDEPQHIKQGRVTLALLEAMEIPTLVIADTESGLAAQLDICYAHIAETGSPYALVVRKDTFVSYKKKEAADDSIGFAVSELPEMTREEAIDEIIRSSDDRELFFSTTGMASRELYELREKYHMGHERDFLTVGSMGHTSSLALSLALQRPELPVTCLDGDGALLMHLGAIAAIGVRKPRNLRHILLNNGTHDSVGGQPTIAPLIDIPAIVRASGYQAVYTVRTKNALRETLSARRDGTVFIDVHIRRGARKDLGRPRSTPEENKDAFMRYLRK
jgi:phosphonopyruvate decarboxylase